jgi:mRNA-degrading endonuclease RelE of RelBE toxin-antitoxin system
VIEVVRRLAPTAKRKVRAALDELSRDPRLGEPLHRELTGQWRLRVGDLRIVYRPQADGIAVVAIGPRRTIYAELASRRATALKRRQ